ncbi:MULTISPECIES: glycosyltransferase family 2 protein [Xenorhabdus]|uniref:glycosyltransferase family 2 protein n=1 Tax=Xenorhabdus TaxID=626 RepID=UPI00064A3CDB|nr:MULTISPECIES: glycosyltransferase family 2 protein [Xenorhabdus]KLU16000.1 glycosyl transferase family 2 [Xenorhabdus griffiniae]KOP33899.1 glycosyl transferase family 2 [Xenorhabdus sp. GDc328]
MKVAVVIPSYKVKKHILDVITNIGSRVEKIYVVDDYCPDLSGKFVERNCKDPRVIVLYNKENLGVGGAVMHGYSRALIDGMDIVVKIDGDGQMDPSLIPNFIAPIIAGEADYTKGNRFFNLEKITTMPKIRLFGNAILSFMTKISSGYWNLFDPTNGYTAIHCDVVAHLPLKKISNRYFFESDILFRLNTLKAVVVDIPMNAKYEDEESNLKISKIIGDFLFKHTRNFFKRIFYNYYLRDMSLASLELPIGLSFFIFGVVTGVITWVHTMDSGIPATSGTVMLSGLPIILGLQLILAFIGHDVDNVPKRPFHNRYK